MQLQNIHTIKVLWEVPDNSRKREKKNKNE